MTLHIEKASPKRQSIPHEETSRQKESATSSLNTNEKGLASESIPSRKLPGT